MSDFDLMEPETDQDVVHEPAADGPAGSTPDTLWPREQMLDRLRTCD